MIKCDFCSPKVIANQVILKTRKLLVILTKTPIVPGHLLILPLRHIGKIDGLTPLERSAIFKIIPKLRQVLEKTFGAKGFNFAWNEGKEAGQSIGHLHFHMVPRKAGDLGITKYEPRKFLYRPGSREQSSKAKLKNIAGILKSELKNIK